MFTTTRAAGLLARIVRPMPQRERASPLGRWLMARGERAAALNFGAGDGVVLSGLGLHLSAAPLLVSASDRASVMAALGTSVALCNVESALAWNAMLHQRWPSSAPAADRLLLPLQQQAQAASLGDGVIAAALRLALGDAGGGLAALQTRQDGLADDPALTMSLLRRLGRHDEADRWLAAFCERQGLRRVRFEPGVGIAGLRCNAMPAAGGPLVSVVMPVRNVAGHIGAALRSVLAQDHAHLEILVVDDASDDETPVAVERAAAGDPRVSLHRRSAAGGAYAARNQGLRLARGEFVTFHDGDDWSHPEKITRQLGALRSRPTAVACTSDWSRMRDDGSLVARQVYPLVRLNMSSMMFRREAVLAAAGCFDEVPAGADSEFDARLRLLFGARAVVRVRTLLSFASCRADSLMHDAATGYASEQGRLQRLRYWEGWNRWHAEVLRAGGPEQLCLQGGERPFPMDSSASASAVAAGVLRT